jgi:hypothetical protein
MLALGMGLIARLERGHPRRLDQLDRVWDAHVLGRRDDASRERQA